MSCIQKLSQLLSEISQYKIFVCLSIKKRLIAFTKLTTKSKKKNRFQNKYAELTKIILQFKETF